MVAATPIGHASATVASVHVVAVVSLMPNSPLELSRAFLENFGIRRPAPRNWPGDTCAGGHPFQPDRFGDCANCESRDLVEDAADYRSLVAHILTKLNPPDNDSVEASRCADAITAIVDYVESLRCRCSIKADGSSCPRCRALGRNRDEKVSR